MQELAKEKMKIFIETLTERPRELKEAIPAADWEMSSSYMDFIDTITIDCSVNKIQNIIHVETHTSFTEKIVCGRCLEERVRPQERAYTFDITEYNANGYLDISTMVREELLLEYPIKALCSDTCKGICPVCGVNLNTETCTCSKKED